jgi:hypothetical protein
MNRTSVMAPKPAKAEDQWQATSLPNYICTVIQQKIRIRGSKDMTLAAAPKVRFAIQMKAEVFKK